MTEFPHRLNVEVAMATLAAIPDTYADIQSIRGTYSQALSLGRFDVRAMVDSEDLLDTLGLVTVQQGKVQRTPLGRDILNHDLASVCEIVVTRMFAARPPAWLRSAVTDSEVHMEYVPDSAATSLESLLPELERREDILLAAARTFDQARRVRDGIRGEELVVREFRAALRQARRDDLATQVLRVSAISDELGYDVRAFSADGARRRIEVKSTWRKTNRVVYVTRNEIDVGKRDPLWYLVVCQLDVKDDYIVGHCQCASLLPLLPRDTPSGTWRVARIELHDSLLTAGIPC